MSLVLWYLGVSAFGRAIAGTVPGLHDQVRGNLAEPLMDDAFVAETAPKRRAVAAARRGRPKNRT
jgi:hypothetical protein